MKVSFVNDTQQFIRINQASKEYVESGELYDIPQAEERFLNLSGDSLLHLTIEEDKEGVLSLTFQTNEHNVRITNLTSQSISIHPATFIHGCHGMDMPIAPKEDAVFLLPEGKYPWVKMWDYKERGGLQVLVSPSTDEKQ